MLNNSLSITNLIEDDALIIARAFIQSGNGQINQFLEHLVKKFPDFIYTLWQKSDSGIQDKIIQTCNDRMLLQAGIKYNDDGFVKKILDHSNILSPSAFVLVVKYENVNFLEKYLSKIPKEKINDQYEGDSLLHRAAFNGNNKIIQLILEHGADPTLKNKSELTAFDMLYKSLEGKFYDHEEWIENAFTSQEAKKMVTDMVKAF